MTDIELIELVDSYIESYLYSINNMTVSIENFFGSDYDSGYHKIVEMFEKIRLAKDNASASQIRSFINEDLLVNKKTFERFAEGIINKKTRTKEIHADSIERIRHLYLPNRINGNVLLKEVRKIEEEINAGS